MRVLDQLWADIHESASKTDDCIIRKRTDPFFELFPDLHGSKDSFHWQDSDLSRVGSREVIEKQRELLKILAYTEKFAAGYSMPMRARP